LQKNLTTEERKIRNNCNSRKPKQWKKQKEERKKIRNSKQTNEFFFSRLDTLSNVFVNKARFE
jgi:hypothetical protein